ncbi:hypothetical protein BKA66DRAFT_476956 [Pyrenochaeta sp. MPI-SDFR-AT-0127]|nr:hypothetical protein BKA66DRAFT_476956 [Pyrenochaeta sp. MPI-SDFR-AT-0127]
MNRVDSGFVESSSKAANLDPVPVHRSNTAPTRGCRPKKAPTDSVSSFQPATMNLGRPTSEKKSRPLRQKSTASSSDNSTTRSKARGHGSKPSSRRTSCTIVDPSRPARHYRIKSSQTATPSANQDVDDVLALHFRSCSLFTNPSYHSNSGLPSPTMSQGDIFSSPSDASRFSSDDLDVTEASGLPKQSEETIVDAEKTNTPMHWTSPCTRQREYERIDKANSGVRGFMRKFTPRCVSAPQEKFYEKDKSDAGSVRRYRLDDVDHHMDEKETSRVHANASMKPTIRASTSKKRWICF